MTVIKRRKRETVGDVLFYVETGRRIGRKWSLVRLLISERAVGERREKSRATAGLSGSVAALGWVGVIGITCDAC